MNIDGWTALIIAITSLLSSGISVLITKIFEGRASMAKTKIEERSADANADIERERQANLTYGQLAELCKDRVDTLEKKLTAREQEVETLREQYSAKIAALQNGLEEVRGNMLRMKAANRHLCHVVKVLTNQLVEAGITPEITPDESVMELDETPTIPMKPTTTKWGAL